MAVWCGSPIHEWQLTFLSDLGREGGRKAGEGERGGREGREREREREREERGGKERIQYLLVFIIHLEGP